MIEVVEENEKSVILRVICQKNDTIEEKIETYPFKDGAIESFKNMIEGMGYQILDIKEDDKDEF